MHDKHTEGFRSAPTEYRPTLLRMPEGANRHRGEGLVMDLYLQDVGRTPMLSQPQEKVIFVQLERLTDSFQTVCDQLASLMGEFDPERLEALPSRLDELKGNARRRAERLHLRATHYRDRILTLRHCVVQANLRLAICIAKKYQNQGLSLMDLIQEANTGLMTAVERFEYHRGVPFGTYASWWVQQAIGQALANQSRTVRLPAYMVEMLRRVNRVREAFAQKHQREPTFDELAELAKIRPALARKLPHFAMHSVAIDKPVEWRSNRTVADTLESPQVSPEEHLVQKRMQEEVQEAIQALPEREAKILKLRYGFEDGVSYSLQEIGDMLDLSRERIRQLEKRALDTLRHPTRASRLQEYLRA